MRLSFSLFLVSVFFLSACERKNKEVDLVTFRVRGEVVAIDQKSKKVTISHEEIPDYMMAMTMPFKVKDSTLLAHVAVGDSVQGTLAVSRSESWLETLFVVGRGEPKKEMLAEDIRIAHLFQKGSPLPDLEFRNQDNKRIRFAQFKPKVLAMTFIYTRCPLPDFCIRMSDYFARIQRELKKDVSLNGKWHLFSVSFDTKFDSPEVLKKYGKNYGADFSVWDFLTGSEATIERITDGFDMVIQSEQGGIFNHNLRTAILDNDGNLVETIISNEWKPEEVTRKMRELIAE
ncbi:MAG: SCO family protein [Ignavibacteriales bacterium]|nr:SCO family protein [Ignavibacteriales bacterium]